jgi:3-phosphoshikimate 1-carboxyvinyltransferase
MRIIVEPSSLSGEVQIPASKSHAIRAAFIASLAEGRSEILDPLQSEDTDAALDACRALGAEVSVEEGRRWVVDGVSGQAVTPDDVINVANSGVTLRVGVGVASLAPGCTVFTGDEQIRARPIGPLLAALNQLGAEAFSTRDNGRAPVVIRGPLCGGRCSLESPTSQYLTSLLICSPLAQGDVEIEVLSLNERPYVSMTLDWLDRQGIQYEHRGLEWFRIPGGQAYRPFQRQVPADFSSATFFLCAAAITPSDLMLRGLDMNDSQGDKDVVGMLRQMGADIEVSEDGIRVRGGNLHGGEFDLNATPDALPSLAVVAAVAEGTTKLLNVPQARLKETDRLAATACELGKMGALIEELPDGLVIHGTGLHGASVGGHRDHRMVMALAVAGLVAEGRTEIDTAEAASVTFPTFFELMQSVGARMEPA